MTEMSLIAVNSMCRPDDTPEFIADYKTIAKELTYLFRKDVGLTEYKFAENMTHDLYCAIGNLGRTPYIYEAENYAHVEDCMRVIHNFFETGTVPHFSTFYTGSNMEIKSLGGHRTYVWNDTMKRFLITVPKEKVQTVVNEMQAAMVVHEDSRAKYSGIIGMEFREQYHRRRIEQIRTMIEDIMYIFDDDLPF